MSYQDQSALYRGADRGRMEMCIREQAFIFSADGRPDIAALGMGVVGGNMQDIDAVMAATCVHQNWAQIAGGDDGALTGAVQEVWPTVAAARYPAAAQADTAGITEESRGAL
jgi:hypothetical protein